MKTKKNLKGRLEAAPLAATVFAWSRELGMSRETLAKKLHSIDIEVKRNQPIAAHDMFNALTAGFQKSRARLVAAKAQREELKLAVEKKELMPWDEVQTVVRNGAQSMRQRLDSLPSEAAHLCNPTDPEHARLALEGWVKSSLPIIRENNARLDKEAGLK